MLAKSNNCNLMRRFWGSLQSARNIDLTDVLFSILHAIPLRSFVQYSSRGGLTVVY